MERLGVGLYFIFLFTIYISAVLFIGSLLPGWALGAIIFLLFAYFFGAMILGD